MTAVNFVLETRVIAKQHAGFYLHNDKAHSFVSKMSGFFKRRGPAKALVRGLPKGNAHAPVKSEMLLQ